MTSKAQFILFFLVSYGVVAGLADYKTTSIGLSKDFTEGNPVARFLFKHLGKSLTTWLTLVAYIFVSLLISVYSSTAAFTYAGAIAILETIMAIRNYTMLKKVTSISIKDLLPF